MRAAALLLAWASAVAPAQTGLPPAKLREIEKAVAAEMSRQGIPGLTIAVATGHRLRWSGGYGLADLENFVPAKADTVYRLGSISKPVTAVAAMQLAEQGRLDLEAPIRKYVPAFPSKPWPITARLLLCHQAGIRHYRGAEDFNSTRHYEDLAGPLGIFAADPLLFEPGTKYSYTTYGYVLLGAAVEAASGTQFLDYLRARVFEPAGLDRMRADNVYTLIPNRARGYRKTKSGEIENCALADTSNKIPGGGLVSTAEDLVKFALAVERGTLLKPETVSRMFTPQTTRDGRPTGYGLGWSVAESNGPKRVGHGGSQQGTATYLALYPAEGVAIAVMANLEGARPVDLCERVAKILLSQ